MGSPEVLTVDILLSQYKGVIHKSFDRTYKLCNATTRSLMSVDDFISFLYENIHKYDSKRGKVTTWIYQYARAYYRTKVWETKLIMRYTSINIICDDDICNKPIHDVNYTEYTEEERELLHKAIKQLKPEYRKLITDYYYNQLNTQQLKVIYKQNHQTITNKLHRAIKQLRHVLHSTNTNPILLRIKNRPCV